MRRFVQSQAPSTQRGMGSSVPIPASQWISPHQSPRRLTPAARDPSMHGVLPRSVFLMLHQKQGGSGTGRLAQSPPNTPTHSIPSLVSLLANPNKAQRFPVFIREASRPPDKTLKHASDSDIFLHYTATGGVHRSLPGKAKAFTTPSIRGNEWPDTIPDTKPLLSPTLKPPLPTAKSSDL